ncbi:MAG: SUMF1/EgtB/PvdO family nonheme iron enzyme, partial [bacterium]|nr:SUMF1/EgtB/PvdO family nonheme iron enzyme [bacterium]
DFKRKKCVLFADEEELKEAGKIDKKEKKAVLLIKTNVPMQLVPEGEFIMGSGVGEGFFDEMPQRKINLKAFLIDRYEVTNEEFRKSGMKPRRNFGQQFSYPKQPVTGMSWVQAKKYCEMVGKRLPTEAEWEKAARGTDGRRYPWGNEWPDCTKAVFNGNPGIGCGKGRGPWPVGSKPAGASPYGVMDMVGNVSEFVADVYSPGYYQVSPARDPVNEGKKDVKVMRGGQWSSPRYGLRVAQRFPVETDGGFPHVGFRCAQDAKNQKVGN